jgi:hypothetical protein
MSTTTPLANPAAVAAIMATAMPILRQFAAEIAGLAPDEQQRRINKVLLAMRGDEKVH